MVVAYVVDAHSRLLAAVAGLGDADMRRPSLLPGWTVGHVLTHLARNADSHVRRAQAAADGVVVEQYPGGYAGRDAEISAGAGRPSSVVLDDLRASCDALASCWASLPAAAWDAMTTDVAGRSRPLSSLPWRRWQEVEVHLVDLDIGITHRSWSTTFVEAWLPLLRGRASPSALALASGTLDSRDELLWLFGRLRRPDLPAVPDWV